MIAIAAPRKRLNDGWLAAWRASFRQIANARPRAIKNLTSRHLEILTARDHGMRIRDIAGHFDCSGQLVLYVLNGGYRKGAASPICKNCGTSLQQRAAGSGSYKKYCGACRTRHRVRERELRQAKRPRRFCAACGVFVPPGEHQRKYCSDVCRPQKHKEKRAQKPAETIARFCSNADCCVDISHMHATAKYCSVQCRCHVSWKTKHAALTVGRRCLLCEADISHKTVRAIYCGRACSDRAYEIAAKERRPPPLCHKCGNVCDSRSSRVCPTCHSKKHQDHVERPCIVCGINFPHAHPAAKHCSCACARVGRLLRCRAQTKHWKQHNPDKVVAMKKRQRQRHLAVISAMREEGLLDGITTSFKSREGRANRSAAISLAREIGFI